MNGELQAVSAGGRPRLLLIGRDERCTTGVLDTKELKPAGRQVRGPR